MEFIVQETGTKFIAKLERRYVSEFADITENTLNEVHGVNVYDGDTITIALASYIVHLLKEYVNPSYYDDCLEDLNDWRLTIDGFNHAKWGWEWRKSMGRAFA